MVPAHGDLVATTAISWRRDCGCEKVSTLFLLGALDAHDIGVGATAVPRATGEPRITNTGPDVAGRSVGFDGGGGLHQFPRRQS